MTKITVEKVGKVTEKVVDKGIPEAILGNKPELVSMRTLKEEAIKLGVPKEDVAKFDNEELLKITVNTLKANQTPAIESPRETKLDEKRWRSKADRQETFFDSQEKVTVLIPPDSGEKPGVVETKVVNGHKQTIVKSGAVWSKTFNGYRVIIPKGVYTPVAKDVAKNLSDELNQTMMAGEQWKLDRIDPTTGRSVREQLI